MYSFVHGFFYLFMSLSVLLSSSISFVLIIVLLSIRFILDVHSGCFQFGCIINNTALNIYIYMYRYLGKCMHVFVLGIFLRVELLSNRECI